MHKSIFLQINEFKTDPISEFNKIESFIEDTYCASNIRIIHLLNDIFPYSKILSSNFISFINCAETITNSLSIHKNDDFKKLDASTQELILEQYLNFSEILLSLFYTFIYEVKNHSHRNFYENILKQFENLIITSLSKLGYNSELINKIDYETRVFKKNEEAEMVAAQSSKNIKDTIIAYLSTRDNDIDGKNNELHNLIDLLEPTFSKYNDGIVKEIREYAQLLRHPVKNNERDEYKWFYEDKGKYIDKIFSMCIFAQHYELTKEDLKSFKEYKKEGLDAKNGNKSEN